MSAVPEDPLTKNNPDRRIQELMKKIAHERDPRTFTKWVSELNQLVADKSGAAPIKYARTKARKK